jgi:SRSO17 transposase
MKVPCAKPLAFLVTGLSFLKPGLTNIQFDNMVMVATALVLGSSFNLSRICQMWLKEKAVSTLSYFLSDAKLHVPELQLLYAKRIQQMYDVQPGNFLIDDTMKHHTKFCKWIHGVFVLFDHAFGTNLKATCIVFLYYSDGNLIKFPIAFRLYYKETGKMPWQRGKTNQHKTKYDLAIEMLQWALQVGFPKSLVLADSWFCMGPFIKALKQLGLSYVIEVKASYTVRGLSKVPKLTPTGRLAKNQYEQVALPKLFQYCCSVAKYGFSADPKIGKKQKVLYHTKIKTLRLNSISGRHRVVESVDPTTETTKYLLTDQLTWEAGKILSAYSNRWVIEEFFRNAKQLTDMEGATIRSEQGVAITLCLVSWIDSLLHFENYKQSTAGKLSKGSVTIPSIIRQAQHENLVAVLERVKREDDFLKRWLLVEEENIFRQRKSKKELMVLDECQEHQAKEVKATSVPIL